MKEFNINNECQVTLTEFGAKVYNNFNSRFDYPPNLQPKKLKSGDFLKTSLWEIMQIFGSEIYMGMTEIPFVENKITIYD